MPGGVHPPFSVILSWPTPNYVNPETRGPGLFVVSIVFGIITTLLVSLRIWARFFLIRQPGLDDVLIIFGYIFVMLLTSLVILANVKYGVGIHIWDLKLTKAAHARLLTWLSQFPVIIGSSCTKISILLFYRRLAAGSYSKSFLWAVRLGILYNLMYCFGFILYIFVECRPLDAYWQQFSTQWNKKYTCGNEHVSLPANGGLSVLSDFYAALLPALLLRHLQMPKKQKVLLYCLFALGFLVVGAGIARTVYMDRVINRSYDTTWNLFMMWLWTLVENYLAICCASAPALKPLYVQYIAPPIISAIGYVARSSGKNTDDYSTALSRASHFGLTSTASSRLKNGDVDPKHARRHSGRKGEKDVETGLEPDFEAGRIMVKNEIMMDIEEVGEDPNPEEVREGWNQGERKGRRRNSSSGSDGITIGEERQPSWMLPVPPSEIAWGINGKVYGGGGGMGRAL